MAEKMPGTTDVETPNLEPASSQEETQEETPKKQSNIFTIICAGAALISDGYQNHLMTMVNVVFDRAYGHDKYTSVVKSRVSNALLIGQIFGYGRSSSIIFDRQPLKTPRVFESFR